MQVLIKPLNLCTAEMCDSPAFSEFFRCQDNVTETDLMCCNAVILWKFIAV